MAQIIKFPGEASKRGYRRVSKRARAGEDPNQLDFFRSPKVEYINFAPDSSSFAQALSLDERGDARRAAELYLKAIQEQDCVADAYCNLGIIESQKGDQVKALDYFTISLKNDPRHSAAHYNLANLYFELNDFRLARIHYEVAGEIDPAFANAHFNLALVQAINSDAVAAARGDDGYQ